MPLEVIPPDMQKFVEQEVAVGNYESPEEVITEALRLLRERKLFELRKEIDAGIEQVNKGEVICIKDESAHRAFFEEIRARGRKRMESTGTGQ